MLFFFCACFSEICKWYILRAIIQNCCNEFYWFFSQKYCTKWWWQIYYIRNGWSLLNLKFLWIYQYDWRQYMCKSFSHEIFFIVWMFFFLVSFSWIFLDSDENGNYNLHIYTCIYFLLWIYGVVFIGCNICLLILIKWNIYIC